MKRFLILFVFAPLLTLGQKVKIDVVTHIPYCGAARPTAEIGRGRDEQTPNYTVILIERTTKKRIEIKTNAEGSWSGKLKSGVYEAYRLDKTLSTDELKTKYKLEHTENFRYQGDECLDAWKLEPDYVLEVAKKKKQSFTITIRSYCYRGTIPCWEYTGPKPY